MSKTPQTHNNPSQSPLTLEQVRRRTRKKLHSAVNSSNNILLDSEPGSGKTTQLPGVIDDLDSCVLYLTARAELYDQMERLCKKEGVDAKIVPRLYKDCPAFASSPETADEELAHTYHQAGVSGTLIHSWLNLHPNTNCQFVTEMRDFEPEQHQVLIGHYTLANFEKYTSDRTVIVDEFPEESYITHVKEPEEPVSEFLEEHDLPYADWTDLVENRKDPSRRKEALSWFSGQRLHTKDGLPEGPFHVLNTATNNRHVRGAFLTLSMLYMDDLGNGFETVNKLINNGGETMPESSADFKKRIYFSHETCVRNRESNEMWILSPPKLSDTNGVVGLDGTPTPTLWNLVLDVDLEHRKVLSPEERERYFSEVQDYTIKQASFSSRHNSSGRNMTPEIDKALFEYIKLNETCKPCLIAPDSSLDGLEQRRMLGHIKIKRNFADIRSSNAFKGEQLGVIPYAPHPGDDTIKRWGALIGDDVKRMEKRGTLYGRIGDKIYKHMVHSRILQAIYRFGRDGSGATVYVATTATPMWVSPDEHIDVSPFQGEKKRAVSRFLRQNSSKGFTAKQVANQTKCTPRHARTALKELCENGYVSTELGLLGAKKHTWNKS